MSSSAHERPVVEERGHLLPGRRNLPGLERRRHGRPRGTERAVDYLAGMGVSRLWLMPFYPSPNRDDGYDVTDCYGVDERPGTLGDFDDDPYREEFGACGVNSSTLRRTTSPDRHPWFRAAPLVAEPSPLLGLLRLAPTKSRCREEV